MTKKNKNGLVFSIFPPLNPYCRLLCAKNTPFFIKNRGKIPKIRGDFKKIKPVME
jgi:hypothetical protein